MSEGKWVSVNDTLKLDSFDKVTMPPAEALAALQERLARHMWADHVELPDGRGWDYCTDQTKASFRRYAASALTFMRETVQAEMAASASPPTLVAISGPPGEQQIGLTEWERGVLLQYASSNALSYMGHDAHGGLRESEISDMKRWKKLSAKLGLPLKEGQ